MANDLKENKNKNGIYIRGDVISNSAKIVKMKDSTTRVSVKHEIALEPGILVLDQLLDPFNDNRVKIDGDEVKSFPTLEKFQSILVRTNRIKEFNNQMSASDWEIVLRFSVAVNPRPPYPTFSLFIWVITVSRSSASKSAF